MKKGHFSNSEYKSLLHHYALLGWRPLRDEIIYLATSKSLLDQLISTPRLMNLAELRPWQGFKVGPPCFFSDIDIYVR